MKLEDILPRPEHLTSEVCLEMKSVGLNPLMSSHLNKFLAWKDRPDLVKLWEGPEWKFAITEEQYKELEELVEKYNKMEGMNQEAMMALINDKIMEFLPEVQIMPTDEKSRYLVERIINDEPIYFKTNKTFKEKAKEKGIEKKDYKISRLVFWEDKLFSICIKPPTDEGVDVFVNYFDCREDDEIEEELRNRYKDYVIIRFDEELSGLRELIIDLDKNLKALNKIDHE